MVARRLPSILPPLTLDEALDVTRVHSVAGVLGSDPIARIRPFRAPHHSISAAGLVGGGRVPAPGEASLAQHGVLFLDELSEFSRPALEALRQPLEEGSVCITRSQRTVTFPARFMFVGASNPCPCGHAGDARRDCTCPEPMLARYKAKLSGALLDRIDIVVRVEQPTRAELRAEAEPESSAAIRERVIAARIRQHERRNGSRRRMQRGDEPGRAAASVPARRRCGTGAQPGPRARHAHDARTRPRAACGTHAGGPRRP